MKKQLLFILLLLTSVSLSAIAETLKLEIISLNKRLASDVIPIIRPHIVKGGTITGTNNKLILKTTPSNIEHIKTILTQIDSTPRRLLISVKQDLYNKKNRRDSGLSGHYQSNNAQLRSPDTNNNGSFIQGTDNSGNMVQYRTLNMRSNLKDKHIFRVQTLEGSPAFISTGYAIPIPIQNIVTTNSNTIIQDKIQYHDASSGFYVLPRLQGDIVTLSVAPKLLSVNSNQATQFDIQKVDSTVSGKLGEWFLLSSIIQTYTDNNQRNLTNIKRQEQKQINVLVKVEKIKE